jgi:DNA-binding transcriptional MerR regulator
MLLIGELSQKTGVSAKTIRYYEEIGLLPPTRRADNGYRIYGEADVEQLAFIKSARALDFMLDDVAEILAFKERGEPPCSYVLALMAQQVDAVSERIRQLEKLRAELAQLLEAGQKLPEDIQMRTCVCHLISLAPNEDPSP